MCDPKSHDFGYVSIAETCFISPLRIWTPSAHGESALCVDFPNLPVYEQQWGPQFAEWSRETGEPGRVSEMALNVSGMALATGFVRSDIHRKNRRLAPCRSRTGGQNECPLAYAARFACPVLFDVITLPAGRQVRGDNQTGREVRSATTRRV